MKIKFSSLCRIVFVRQNAFCSVSLPNYFCKVCILYHMWSLKPLFLQLAFRQCFESAFLEQQKLRKKEKANKGEEEEEEGAGDEEKEKRRNKQTNKQITKTLFQSLQIDPVLVYCFKTQPGHLQQCLSFLFLLVLNLEISQK